MSQVDNRNSSAAKRARTDGGRREDDWTCPSCGNVNFSFRTTCNMRNCTQSRPADHNGKSAPRPMQPHQSFSSPGRYLGSGAPSPVLMGGSPYGSSLFNGSSMSPYDVPFSGGSPYHFNYNSRFPPAGPHYRPFHMSGPPSPYHGRSMMGSGMYGMALAPMDRYGFGMAMSPAAAAAMMPRPGGYFADEKSQKRDLSRENDWACPNCGNVNFSFRTMCNMRKCNTPKPGPQLQQCGSSDKTSNQTAPEGSWKCDSCGNINYPFRSKCNRQNCGGSLHPSIGTLLSLRHINLKNNKFQGKLPAELFAPEELQSLVLSGNSFSGFVPEELGRLKSLITLDLSKNSFNGSIPLSLLQCKKLKTLVLSNNNFSGDLPTRFGSSLVQLRTLNLSFNRLRGTIPEDISNLKNLKGTLDLSHNSFSGMIPTSLGDLPEVLYVDLSHNNLSGPIPQSNVLLNAGPNAFQGNPLLCGIPTKVSCATRNTQVIPSQLYTQKANHHSRVCTIITATGCTVAGIIFLVSLFIYHLRKASATRGDKDQNNRTSHSEKKTMQDFLCFKTGNSKSEALDENKTQQVFIPMDPEIQIDLDQLLKASAFLLGKSRIGLVYKVVLENGLMLAVRRLEDKGWLRLKEFLADVEAMAKIKHPNVLNLQACCWSQEEKLLIYDYIPNGDLGSAIQGRPGSLSCKQLSWPVRLRILRGIAKGLTYIHEFSAKRYVHGNINSSNILLGPNLEPKISGFGLGRIVDMPSSDIRSDQISPMESRSPSVSREAYYQAPEASKMTKPSQKWDVYSFGLVVLEMVTGKFPVMQMSSSETDLVMWVEAAAERNKPVWYVLDPVLARDRDMEDSMVQVVKIGLDCVKKSPDKRPSMRNVFESFEKLASSI